MDNIEMTSTEESAGSHAAQPPASQMTPNDPHEADLEHTEDDADALDEFSANPLTDDETDTLSYDDDADPDVAAVDSAMSASRKQRLADKNSNIRRLLEERSEARQLQQDLDYLDFDD